MENSLRCVTGHVSPMYLSKLGISKFGRKNITLIDLSNGKGQISQKRSPSPLCCSWYVPNFEVHATVGLDLGFVTFVIVGNWWTHLQSCIDSQTYYDLMKVVMHHFGQCIDMQLLELVDMFSKYLLAFINRKNTLAMLGIQFFG